jgi:hypothetical protein
VAEQSHKREMSDAIRGDFERLRARRERGSRAPAPTPARPERVILTPPRPPAGAPEETPVAEVAEGSAPEPEEEPTAPDEVEVEQTSARTRSDSWLRSVLRRR